MPLSLADIPAALPAERTSFIHPLDRLELIGYFEQLRLAHGSVKLVGLPDMDQRNDDLPLGSLFVEPRVGRQPISAASFDERTSRAATSPMLAAIAENQRLILLGDPGAGKTTVVNWLCTALAQALESPVTSTLGRLVPLPFILRDLPLGVDLSWDALLDQFLRRPLASSLASARPLLIQLLASGQALILLDGIDEVGSDERRQALRNAVWEGWTKFPRCRWILTSRIVGYDEAPFDQTLVTRSAKDGRLLNVFESGMEFIESRERLATVCYVTPFSDAQVNQFVENWFRLREPDPALARETIHDLLAALAGDPGTKELARIPNLLTLIALIYRVRAKLPDGRAELYFQIAQAYLKTIDEFRKLDRDLPPYSFEEKLEWLARVGWEMQHLRTEMRTLSRSRAPREYIATETEVLGWLAAAMQPRYPDCSAQESKTFLNYVRRRTGLLLERGDGRYAFLHLSFQEFFAARYLVSEVDDPDWVLENLGTNAAPNPRDPVSAFSLRAYCGLPLWQESLVFLFESLSLKWSERIVKGLYPESGDDFTRFTPQEAEHEKTGQSRWNLAARLAGDPHVALSALFRENLMTLCWRWQLAGMKKKWRLDDPDASSVARQLLARRDTTNDGWRALVRVGKAEDPPIVLSLAGCTALSSLGPLSMLPGLQMLSLDGCTAVSDLSPLAALSRLQTLYLDGCTAVSDLGPLAALSSLQTLTFNGYSACFDLSPLAALSSLETLYLVNCTAVSDLGPLATLASLETLCLANCTAVRDLDSLAKLSSLETLNIDGCTAVSTLSPLAALFGLHTLSLNYCSAVSDLVPLAKLSSLEKLNLANCTAVSSLTPLAKLSSLKTLDLADCTTVSDLTPLATLSSLQWLNFDGCTAVSDLSPLAALSSLQTLDFGNCTAVSDLSPLAKLSDLKTINFTNCPAVSDLSPLAALASLQTLYIDGCNDLNDFGPLTRLSSLRTLSCSSEHRTRFAHEIDILKQRNVQVY